ncbi:hypothetical protein HII36_28515 [Nonomuraea sp. NN258]|nr:hypothetical protein [Nonomuraea antri]NRQ35747.1 hypothetical protein [Nonomuraea antri]
MLDRQLRGAFAGLARLARQRDGQGGRVRVEAAGVVLHEPVEPGQPGPHQPSFAAEQQAFDGLTGVLGIHRDPADLLERQVGHVRRRAGQHRQVVADVRGHLVVARCQQLVEPDEEPQVGRLPATQESRAAPVEQRLALDPPVGGQRAQRLRPAVAEQPPAGPLRLEQPGRHRVEQRIGGQVRDGGGDDPGERERVVRGRFGPGDA